MRFVYADPPYLGCGQKHYGHQHELAGDYDKIEAHHALLVRIRDGNPSGFAVSLHTPSLEEYAHLCREVFGPNVVRWGGWFKPFASFKPGVNPAYCWEPIAFVDSPRKRSRKEATVRDYTEQRDPLLEAALASPAVKASITLKRGTSGAKPDPFSYWLFDVLGMEADDDLEDWFPGSGAVTRAWKEWRWHRGAA